VQQIANLLHNEGQFELAYLEVNKALSIDSKCKPALYLKAKLLERRNKTKASKELLKKLLVLEPNHLEALETLGRIQMSVGDFEEASQNFKVFLKIKYDKRINDLYRSCFESLQKASL
jgi:tetratricopeptide (TPR) repeat protein